MNNIILLQIISLVGIFIIAIIVVYQFVQEQQALNRIDKMLNPPKPKDLNYEPSINYNTYQECIDYWNKAATVEGIPDIMCEKYK